MQRRFHLLLILALLVGLAACGNSGSSTFTNPTPAISANSPFSPSSAVAGSAAFSLTVNGSGFVSTSQVQWNGSNRVTTFVSSTQLAAAITADDVASPGSASVTVVSPAPGGGTSNVLMFTISNPPAITQLSSTSGPVGTSVTITGSNFGATQGTSIAQFNGTTATSITSWSASSIVTAVPAGATTGDVTVTVGGVASNGVLFTVTAPVLPMTVTLAGTGSGTVTSSPSGINCPGTCSASFNSGAAVVLTASAASGSTFAGWSGACSGTGTCSVTMSAAKSVTATFNVGSTLTKISPTSIGANTPSFLLTLTGTGFTMSSVVHFAFNSTTTNLTPASVSPDQTTATVIVPASAIADASISTNLTATITVAGASGQESMTIASAVTPVSESLSITGTALSEPVRLAFVGNALMIGEQQVLVSGSTYGYILRATISGGVATVDTWASFLVDGTSSYHGLLGMAPDPADPPTASGGSVFVFYTSTGGDNRIAKVSFGGAVQDLVTGLPVAQSGDQDWLNGGKLAVYTDPTTSTSYLFASTGGSDLDPNWSQISSTSNGDYLHGKILRYNTDGSIPTDNPFGTDNPIYACGFRNSFGFDFHPTSGALYATDNGNQPSSSQDFPWWDALDRVTAGDAEGFGYGYSGTTCQASVTNPLWGGGVTSESPSDIAPAGTMFYTGSVFPQLQNTLLVTGDNFSNVYQYAVDEYASPAGTLLPNSPSAIISGLSVFGLTDLAQGPDGCIYIAAESGNVARLKPSTGASPCM